jgi:hypothetical protein
MLIDAAGGVFCMRNAWVMHVQWERRDDKQTKRRPMLRLLHKP